MIGNGLWTRLYLRAPPWGQSAMLSVYGGWLRHLRYGGIHHDTLRKLRVSRALDLPRIQRLQVAALRRLVLEAQVTVPFYRERLADLAPEELQDLERLPLLTKAEVRDAGEAMVSQAPSAGPPLEIHTGGTTGSPLTIHCDRDALRRNYAFFSRFLEGSGVSHGARVATFAGRVIVPATQRHPPYWRRNYAGNAALFSSYHLAPDTLPAYAEALRRFAPDVIDSYPSSLDPIARHLLATGVTGIRPRAVITSSETLEAAARDRIERAFGCRVYDHYGSAEMVAFITQCAAGTYHANPEYGIVEVRCDGRAARPGEIGEMVATGFVNPRMPLIRYVTGDLAEAGDGECSCGWRTPTIARLLGRQDDVVITPEGRRVGRLDPIFKSVSALLETRIVQDRRDHVRVETVLAGPWPEAARVALVTELARRLGPRMRIDVVPVPRLPRERGGKLRSVVNLVDPRSATDPADGSDPADRVGGAAADQGFQTVKLSTHSDCVAGDP